MINMLNNICIFLLTLITVIVFSVAMLLVMDFINIGACLIEGGL